MTSLNSWPINRLHAELIRRHISWTKPRNEVYLALGLLGPCRISHLIPELADRVNRRTIFNTVKLFLEIGIVIRVSHDLIELAPPYIQHRHYLICKSCGRRIPFFDEPLEKALAKLIKSRRFTSQTHQIEVAGRCEMCP